MNNGLGVSMNSVSVAIAVPSGEIASGLIGIVERHPLLDLCGVARSPGDLARLLERFHPAVLLISPQMLEELEGCEFSIAAGHLPHLTLSFLLVSGGVRWEEADLVRAFRHPFLFCGALNADTQDPDELFGALKEKVALFQDAVTSSRPAMEGRIPSGAGFVTLVGCKGGVGCTLISCAISSALSRAGTRTLLLDLDRERSQLLHLKPVGEGKTLLDLLPLAEEISWDLVRMSVYRHPDGFHLLPFGMNQGGSREVEIPEALLRNLGFIFDLVILDLPGNFLQDFRSPLLTSKEVLLVCPADTLSVRCARGTASLLRRMGIDQPKLRLVINRSGPHSSLRPHELSHAVGIEETFVLPEDARSGLDFAELAYLPRRDSPLGRAVHALAEALLGEAHAPRGTAARFLSAPPNRVPVAGKSGRKLALVPWRK